MRFIQVGVGGFGGGWVQRLTDSKQAQIVGLVDVNANALGRAREVGNYSAGICFGSLTEALANVETDAVVCVTPPEYHSRVVIQAMKAGLDVITEKPMADTLRNCTATLKAARDTGRTCVVSQNYRYKKETWTLANLVKSGRIGEIGQVKIDFYKGHDFGGGFRHDIDHPLLVDMSIHHFDLIRFVTGLDPVSVRGEAWNPPWSNYRGDCSSSVVFEMSNGSRVVYSASWCAKGQFCNWDGNWQIEGSKGTLEYVDGKVTLHTASKLYTVTRSAEVPLKGPRPTAQEYVLADFVRSVKKGSRPRTDVFDNIHSIAMVFAAVKAVDSGRRVPVLDNRLKQLLA